MITTATARRFRKTTIKDVAARAGVSVTTVSEFVNGRARACSPDTATRINEAISFLHYTPGSLVNGLRKSESRAIGACFTFPASLRGIARNAFVERLWNGVVEAADAANYLLVHYPAAIRNDRDNYRAFLDGRVDGLLMALENDDNRLSYLDEAGMPTVSLTRFRNLPAHVGCVYTDERHTVDLALSHLWEMGHRRIGHLTGPVIAGQRPSDIALARRDAYRDWLAERDAFGPNWLVEGDSWDGKETAEIAVERWLAGPNRPTAVFCANDNLAAYVIRAAKKRGMSVPEELSVVGVDNEAQDASFDPPITSVDIPGEQLGQAAFRALLQLMGGAPIESCRVALPVTDLIVRGSTAPPRP